MLQDFHGGISAENFLYRLYEVRCARNALVRCCFYDIDKLASFKRRLIRRAFLRAPFDGAFQHGNRHMDIEAEKVDLGMGKDGYHLLFKSACFNSLHKQTMHVGTCHRTMSPESFRCGTP